MIPDPHLPDPGLSVASPTKTPGRCATLMVQGASSSAGKSLVVTALARHFARLGLKVAPFKAQNMSNNARVVAGGEIGSAQYYQALAAGVTPDVRMNPVLIKPEAGGSQVILHGRPAPEISDIPWTRRADLLWPAIRDSLASLRGDADLILIEGAGSPAEINLWDSDLANMRVASEADAPVILVADIDRGGAFAHLYGTWALLPEIWRSRIRGFLLNKFRGDPTLIEPAPADLEVLTGVPTIGLIPWLHHDLPDEDAASLHQQSFSASTVVAVISYPTISNFDEFRLLAQGAQIRWAHRPADLDGADFVILPGSKDVPADLRWLHDSGLAAAIRRRVVDDQPVLAICGGLQMLGERIDDRNESVPGLGLLPVTTEFKPAKTVTRASLTLKRLNPPWDRLNGHTVDTYEIRHGRVSSLSDPSSTPPYWQHGPLLGLTGHGLLESPAVVKALIGSEPDRTLDQTFDRLADAIEHHCDTEFIHSLLEPK